MIDWNSEGAGAFMVPEPLRQIGDYELDLLKLGFFGWMNAATIATEFWLQQLATMAPVSE